MASVTNSPGTVVDDATVGTVAWSNPNNAKVSDNVYATAIYNNAVDDAHYLKATNFGFSIPAGATINGILVEVQKKLGNAAESAVDQFVKIVKGGAVGATNKADTTTEWSTTEAYKSYGGSSDLWGTTWTPTDINASNFGFVITPQGGAGASVDAQVDHIRITVYYTETSPGTMTGVQSMTGVSSLII